MDTFSEKVQKWMIYDKQMKIINQKTKDVRERKHQLTEEICRFIKERKLNKIEITDGELKIAEKREYSPITFGYLEKTLGKIMEKKQVESLIEYLKKNREITITNDIHVKYISTKSI